MAIFCTTCERKLKKVKEDVFVEGDIKGIDTTYYCNECDEEVYMYREEEA